LFQGNRDHKRRRQEKKTGQEFVLAKMYSLNLKKHYISYSCNINLGKEMCLQRCTL
jgi:hypothetical protein